MNKSSIEEQFDQIIEKNISVTENTTEVERIAILDNVIQLHGNWKELLQELHLLGTITAVTTNDNAIHEKTGVYDVVTFQGPVGTALTKEIDLRLFMMHWAHGYLVPEKTMASFQFFAKNGQAIQKIYFDPTASPETYSHFISKYGSITNTSSAIEIVKDPVQPIEKPDNEIDQIGLQNTWRLLKDTHEFFGMLQEFEVSRVQALRLAPSGYVRKIPTSAIYSLLLNAVTSNVSIMAFVGNKGCIQIHTGCIYNVSKLNQILKIQDQDFCLQLKEDQMHNAYIVQKSTDLGIVTSVEVFDKTGELIVQFFGDRKPTLPEPEEWRNLLRQL
ncbi:ChuX/HutX family heme-like substrate-binding protein [Flavobacterium sp. '19STA2R22 D10 B1']|uniref:ChuX/HutX family heme-like substrate-binding protein n=1 Tax=Flavobacterium aerium TaxID=3037261 RepID=UPI00278C3194|nr:ChuX/HutX family heme-like substrate-binding protein [Flavobacterium sp. '19STA2R22 D10 B1']